MPNPRRGHRPEDTILMTVLDTTSGLWDASFRGFAQRAGRTGIVKPTFAGPMDPFRQPTRRIHEHPEPMNTTETDR